MNSMKGQGLSITTIVVAAIALLILIVLVAVFTGQFGAFGKGLATCDARGGIWITADETCPSGTTALPGEFIENAQASTAGQCCVGVEQPN